MMDFNSHPEHFTIVKNPMKRVNANRNPSSADIFNLSVGDEWLNVPAKIWWKLVDFDNSKGSTWAPLCGVQEGQATINNMIPPLNNHTIAGSDPINVSNDPKTGTVSIGFEGKIANQFITDRGSVVPYTGAVKVYGSEYVSTFGFDNHLVIGLKSSVATYFSGDSGTSNPTANLIKITGDMGLKTAAKGNEIKITAEPKVPLSFKTENGKASASLYEIKIMPGKGISTSAEGNQITISALTPQTPIFKGNAGNTASMSNSFTLSGKDGSGISTSCNEGEINVSLSHKFSDGDFTFENNLPATPRVLSISNKASDPNADSILKLHTLSKEAGSPFIQYSVGNNLFYLQGLNNINSTFDLCMSENTEEKGRLLKRITSDGVQSIPNQPSFMASVTQMQNAVTGDGFTYPVCFDCFHNDVKNASPRDTFVIPHSGVWSFQGCVCIENIWTTHTEGLICLKAANKTFLGACDNPRSRISGPRSSIAYNGSWTLKLNAGDKVSLIIQVCNGTKVVNVFGSMGTNVYCTYLSGAMLS